jgi:hypothetical protein
MIISAPSVGHLRSVISLCQLSLSIVHALDMQVAFDLITLGPELDWGHTRSRN